MAFMTSCSLVARTGTSNGTHAESASAGDRVVDNNIEPVVLTNPSADAAIAIRLCGVEDRADQVVGMGRVTPGRSAPNYVPLTGREPEIDTDEPAWVVEFAGELRFFTRSNAGVVTATDPVCVVVAGEPYWFLTGPFRTAQGDMTIPAGPETTPSLALPPLIR
jgi:hypothetical protein